MSKLVSRIGMVSAFTMLSRILGLARDMLTSALLGASVWNSAFITAFTLPNLFRRLLGEGALTAALMPNLSEELEANGRAAVHALVNKVLSWLVLICLGLTTIAWIALEIYKPFAVSEKWGIAAGLGQILFPYVLLICVAAIFAAALNLFSKFGIPALTAVWLNSSIIFALGYAGWWLGSDMATKTYWLCGGALVGGLLQMVVPAIALAKEGWRPKVDFAVSDRVRKVALLTIPGIFGGAVAQINILVSRTLAFDVSDAAASLLYYANRLVELPVGVFAIAISTVVFPSLAQAVAGKRMGDFSNHYRKGILLCMLMAVPSAIGLIVLSQQILELLFQRGLFTGEDVAATVPLVFVFAIGMPFYSFAAVETRAFFALKDTKSPVRIAVVAFVVNLSLSLFLMNRMGALGLAIASNTAIVVQVVGLHVLLGRKELDTSLRKLSLDSLRIVSAAAVMGALVFYGNEWCQAKFTGGIVALLIPVLVLIPLGVAVYFGALQLLGLGWRKLLEK